MSTVSLPTGPPDPFSAAKAFLQKAGVHGGTSLYDHMSHLILRVLEERPLDAVAQFELLSQRMKREALPVDAPELPETVSHQAESELASARLVLQLFQEPKGKKAPTKDTDEDNDNGDDGNDGDGDGEESEGEATERSDDSNALACSLPNLMEQAERFESVGMSLGRTTMHRLWLAMLRLARSEPTLVSMRLFGKILGTNADYYVVEAETEVEAEMEAGGSPSTSPREGMKEEEEDEEEEEENEEEGAEKVKKAPNPEDKVVPPERHTGTNKCVYFVTTSIEGSWHRLPDTTPQQIQAAQLITRFFTGNLEADVPCWPPFPGNEASLLRAQIARIAASTSVSPMGYFHMRAQARSEDGDSMEGGETVRSEETEIGHMTLTLNHNYHRGDPTRLSNWVHHTPFILPQGRCEYWEPPQARRHHHPESEPNTARTEETEDESRYGGSTARTEDVDVEDEEPEEGPALLTPLSKDTLVAGGPAWVHRVSSRLTGRAATASVHSTRWPGAVALAYGDQFANVYIGYGVKALGTAFTPVSPPAVQSEAPEVEEQVDPTLEEEEAYEAAKKAKEEEEARARAQLEADEDGEGEDEEGEDEDDMED
eukprot:TRINITY_DN2340_c0_g1_i1.p1 TRINITY_DN2340_c0_g1~~TRINITY_DN2340_c0_g1_i1.p1  ORF type:complete len:615 (+),score=157.52 TRINITY_DN2340_c0_g1_i1:52-1845(+)